MVMAGHAAHGPSSAMQTQSQHTQSNIIKTMIFVSAFCHHVDADKALLFDFDYVYGRESVHCKPALRHDVCWSSLHFTNPFDVPRTHRRTIGDRALAAAGPTLWNSPPHDITDCVSLTSFCRISLLHSKLFTERRNRV